MDKSFLKNYIGQTTRELIALKDAFRIDSIVLAFEAAIDKKERTKLSRTELIVLAVESLEREVNNGGYDQFFRNSSREFSGLIVDALREIGCGNCAAITEDALSVLKVQNLADVGAVEQAAHELTEEELEKLNACDERYYQNNEAIADSLFSFIEQNSEKIRIPN